METQCGAPRCKRRCGVHHEGDEEPPRVESEAAGGEDGEQQEGAARGEGDRKELEQKVVHLPVRIEGGVQI